MSEENGMVSLGEFIQANGLRMRCRSVDENPSMEGSEDMDHWACHITNGNGRRIRVTFSMGRGHNGVKPTLEEVLDCLASDAAGVDNSGGFEDWALEYGYDTDSRKAHRTWQAVCREYSKLERMFGDQLSVLLYSVERE